MTVPALEELERQIQAALARLQELKQENVELREQLSESEARQSAAASGAGVTAAANDAFDNADAEQWRRERDEVRRRVERLTARLSTLLGQAAEDL